MSPAADKTAARQVFFGELRQTIPKKTAMAPDAMSVVGVGDRLMALGGVTSRWMPARAAAVSASWMPMIKP